MLFQGGRQEDEVRSALAGLLDDLGHRLQMSGWKPNELLPHAFAVFTASVAETNYYATVELLHGGRVRRREDWPIDLYIRFGCGFWPTCRLSIDMGTDPNLVLLEEPRSPKLVKISRSDSIVEVSKAIEAYVGQHGLEFANIYSNFESMKTALSDEAITPRDVQFELIPLFLASSGRVLEALQAAIQFLAEEGIDQPEDYPSFVARLSGMMPQ